MSKLYEQYLKLKNNNPDNYYLLESGLFYLFIGEDALQISKILPLKLTHLNEEIYKCGFPKKSVDKYKKLFEENNLQVVINKKEEKKYTLEFCLEIINDIKKLDINNLTPIEALKIIKEWQVKL